MLHTDRADKAYLLLRSYARTPEQLETVNKAYTDLLAEESNEDRVITMLLGYILDGLRYGNWLWLAPRRDRV